MHHHLVISQQALSDDELDRALRALSDAPGGRFWRGSQTGRPAYSHSRQTGGERMWRRQGLISQLPPDEPVISFQRFLKAPPAMVFAAWTKPVFIYETSPDEVCLDTVTFEPFDDGTIVIGHSAFPSLAVRSWYLEAGAARGLTKSDHCLDVLLRTLQETNSGRRLDK